ncbi:MAG: FG-GAP-like repeat-containing protein [Planctomycetota bacterium]|nr:FG-GAP-like repeat-containing protein [Planctomycetota bacterium]
MHRPFPTILLAVFSRVSLAWVSLFSASIAWAPLAGHLRAADCNGNGAADDEDITLGLSADCNRNGVPDECDVAPGAPYRQSLELHTTGAHAILLRAADVDGDGHPDLVVADEFSLVSVFLGDGNGNLRGPGNLPSPGHNANALVVEDLDGDGDVDAAVSYLRTGRVAVFPGDGSGGFGEAASFGAPFPTSMTAGDVDGDSDVDLITEGVVLFNRGDGSFDESLPHGVHEGELAPADVDGDGGLDLLSSRYFLVNTGDVRFKPPVLHGGNGQDLEVVDLDGDGLLDIVQVAGEAVVFLEGVGDGSFQAPVPRVEGVSSVSRLAVRDADGDGILDILLVAADCCPGTCGSLRIYLGRDSGSFELSVERQLDFAPRSFDVADFDGDGRLDVTLSEELADRVLLLRATTEPSSRDDDGDGVPDECGEPGFRRGDSNADGARDLTDAIFILTHLFLGGNAPPCEKSADANDSGAVDLSDAVYLLSYLFLGGPPPGEPFADCGSDPTDDPLTCVEFAPCA